ncbi:uncharacterized protein [Porites lutea]|uniref:uncharacterized protein n=1 Tax=Porites lutea TaxID=51062 RepID=UPI003CC5BA53
MLSLSLLRWFFFFHATQSVLSSRPFRLGQWLPSDWNVTDEWLANVIHECQCKYKDKLEMLLALHPQAEDDETALCALRSTDTKTTDKHLRLHKPVEDLKNAILTDHKINMFFHQMFWQQYQLPNSSEGTKIPSWQLMIIIIDHIMTTAPIFNKTALVGLPINAILNWPMATTAGFAAFLNDKVNRLFKNILNYWGEFLSTPGSRYVLTDHPRHGWFGEDAMEAMPNFVEEFKCNPDAPHYGFKSWDDFFTREFRPGVRPVEFSDDDYIVANACESAPYKIATCVKKRDFFWIKRQRYSLHFMLNKSDLAKKFHGGTVYQGYLSATSYHRWHSPVSGTIYKTELVDGSYYSQTYNIQDDPASPDMSQGYLAQVAARGIIYIMADNPDIGLMCFVAIGMSEVSSNEITVKEGDKVKKGDQLGMFHYGGSTHCLIFRPEVKIEFDTRSQTPGLDTDNIPVRAKIATVYPAQDKKRRL